MTNLNSTETQILDQIISDSRLIEKSLEDYLTELDQMPENYVNSICNKSFDEMNDTEKTAKVGAIKSYLTENV